MSKAQEKNSGLFTDIANTAIAGELESRLRELEKNIAVARQFIKLADESYNQVRREWDILQQDIRPTKQESDAQSRPTKMETQGEVESFDEPFQQKKKSKHRDIKEAGKDIERSVKTRNPPKNIATTVTKKEDEPSPEASGPNPFEAGRIQRTRPKHSHRKP